MTTSKKKDRTSVTLFIILAAFSGIGLWYFQKTTKQAVLIEMVEKSKQKKDTLVSLKIDSAKKIIAAAKEAIPGIAYTLVKQQQISDSLQQKLAESEIKNLQLLAENNQIKQQVQSLHDTNSVLNDRINAFYNYVSAIEKKIIDTVYLPATAVKSSPVRSRPSLVNVDAFQQLRKLHPVGYVAQVKLNRNWKTNSFNPGFGLRVDWNRLSLENMVYFNQFSLKQSPVFITSLKYDVLHIGN